MERVALVVCLIVCFAAEVTAAAQPVRVTVRQLLATPENFVGKRVDVSGYYQSGTETSDLFASRSVANGSVDHAIWLEPDIWDPRVHPQTPADIAPSKHVDNHTVRVVGTFHYQPRRFLGNSVPYVHRFQGFGVYRLFKYAILDITYIQPAHKNTKCA